MNKEDIKKKKATGIKALYLYYCYLLKVFPKEYPNKRLSPKIREDINKMDKISKEAKMLVSHDITTYEHLLVYKEKIIDQELELKNKRELLWRKEKRVVKLDEKENIHNEITKLTEDINKLTEEVKLCEGVEERTPIIESKVKEIDENYEKEVKKYEFIR